MRRVKTKQPRMGSRKERTKSGELGGQGAQATSSLVVASVEWLASEFELRFLAVIRVKCLSSSRTRYYLHHDYGRLTQT